MARRRTNFFLAAALLGGVASCSADTESPTDDPGSKPPGPGGGGKSDGVCFNVKAEKLAPDAEPDLVPSGNIPLPSFGPTADGWFHPPTGYSEGGTFMAPDNRPEWSVDPASIAPPAPAGRLRVVEWNVERGNKLVASIRLMRRLNADVFVLNEADLYGLNSGSVVVAREIARALGYSYYTTGEFYEKREDRRGLSGNAIVSRYPMNDVRSMSIPLFLADGGYDWSTSTSEPRCGQRAAMSARIDVPTADGGFYNVNVVGLHTENKGNAKSRLAQFEAVRDKLVHPGDATLMAGDLNTVSFFEGSNFRKYLDEQWQAKGPTNALFDCSRGDDTTTFSAAVVVNLRIDWMLMQPGNDEFIACPVGAYSVVGNDGASDHKPVITEFSVTPIVKN